jgi:hypothetical protein
MWLAEEVEMVEVVEMVEGGETGQVFVGGDSPGACAAKHTKYTHFNSGKHNLKYLCQPSTTRLRPTTCKPESLSKPCPT